MEFAQIPNGIKNPRKNGFKDADMKFALASECPNDGPLIDEAKSCLEKLAKTNGFTSMISLSMRILIKQYCLIAKKFTDQLITAGGGIVGALAAVSFSGSLGK